MRLGPETAEIDGRNTMLFCTIVKINDYVNVLCIRYSVHSNNHMHMYYMYKQNNPKTILHQQCKITCMLVIATAAGFFKDVPSHSCQVKHIILLC